MGYWGHPPYLLIWKLGHQVVLPVSSPGSPAPMISRRIRTISQISTPASSKPRLSFFFHLPDGLYHINNHENSIQQQATMKMHVSFLSTWISMLTVCAAHNIQLGAHSRECFHEELHKDDKMTVTFQVGDREFGGAGNLEVDFWVNSPSSPPSLSLGNQLSFLARYEIELA